MAFDNLMSALTVGLPDGDWDGCLVGVVCVY